MIPQTKRERVQNFWSPKNRGEDSEFLITQTTQERIQNFWSPKNRGEDSEFLITQTTQERIQNFWSPNNTGEDSEFLTSKQHGGGFRISDAPKNTGEDTQSLNPKQNRRFRISDPPNKTGDSEFQIPQTTQERIQNFWSPKQKYNTGRFSIFRNPYEYSCGIRISDNPNNLRETSYFYLRKLQSLPYLNCMWRVYLVR